MNLIKWLDEKPWTTLFIDGNHENHTRLDKLPLVDMFGSKVGKVNDNIFHLQRGHVYIIEGKKFFTFGGGYSIDKARRITNESWWEREMPNYAEYELGLDNLKKHDNKGAAESYWRDTRLLYDRLRTDMPRFSGGFGCFGTEHTGCH